MVIGRCEVIPWSPLGFGFQLQCFCYVQCNTCVLLAAYLFFALMVERTPPLSHIQTHTPLQYCLLFQQYCFDAITGSFLVTDCLQLKSTSFFFV